MIGDPYLIPGTRVLRNKFDLEDAGELARAERLYVVQRTLEGAPSGNFDFAHLQAIHEHLFQDVYDWAGKIRTVEISKQDSQFQASRFIVTGMKDVHRRLVTNRFLVDQSRTDFAHKAAEIIGDINFIHPFREGNGRVQLEYLRQLGIRAGHEINPDQLDPADWLHASKLAMETSYAAMAHAILTQAMDHKHGGRTRQSLSAISSIPRLDGKPG